MNTNSNRYNRQILLKGFGREGQKKLLSSKVLVIGAGGLGCPVLQILAASGIGHLGIVDDDRISPDNLTRQILFKPSDIGKLKVETAARALKDLNSEIHIQAYPFRLTNKNALDLFPDYDIIVDGTDNFESRYMINDAAVLVHKPLVYGAISEFEGQLSVWNYQDEGIRTTQYRDAFPNPPSPSSFQNCNELGVLGVLTGIIGNLMASEVVKLASGIGKPCTNRIWMYNSLNHTSYDFRIHPREIPTGPKNQKEFLEMDYVKYCSIPENQGLQINSYELESLMNQNDTLLIDVREPGELPVFTKWDSISLPLAQVREKAVQLNKNILVTFCYSGKRSDQAALWLKEIFGDSKTIYSLKGGIKDGLSA